MSTLNQNPTDATADITFVISKVKTSHTWIETAQVRVTVVLTININNNIIIRNIIMPPPLIGGALSDDAV